MTAQICFLIGRYHHIFKLNYYQETFTGGRFQKLEVLLFKSYRAQDFPVKNLGLVPPSSSWRSTKTIEQPTNHRRAWNHLTTVKRETLSMAVKMKTRTLRRAIMNGVTWKRFQETHRRYGRCLLQVASPLWEGFHSKRQLHLNSKNYLVTPHGNCISKIKKQTFAAKREGVRWIKIYFCEFSLW